MEPTIWPRAVGLGSLLTLTAMIILSCTEEPASRASVLPPTTTPVSPIPTVEATKEATPTPTPVSPVPCEEGMILPRNSLCHVPEPPQQSEHMFLNFSELILIIDEYGRAALEGDGEILSTGSELKNWRTGELTEEISFGLNRDHFRSRPEEGCAIGEVEWVTVRAVRNGDGNWTVKTLWQLTHVEEICAP